MKYLTLAQGSKGKWPKELWKVQLALNTSVSRLTHETPELMMFGHEAEKNCYDLVSLSSVEATEYLGGDVLIPQANIINSVEEYENLYQKVGFESVELIEATEECWLKHSQYMKNWLYEEFQAGKMNEDEYNFNVSTGEDSLNFSNISYYLVSAKKL